MVPTIDISVIGILGAIGGFLAWLWSVIKGIFEWCQNKFILFWLGSRVGRAIAEFGLFALWYGFIATAISVVLQWALSQTASLIFPDELKDTWRILQLMLPADALFALCTDLVSYTFGYILCFVAFSHYRRMMRALALLMGVGKV